MSGASGANFTCSDTATAKAVAKRTYEAAVELFAYLCRQYSLNPTADGVIISHREGHSRGIASNHGDPEHLWTQLGMGYTMDTFRQAVKAAMDGGSSAETTDTWYRVRKTWADAKSQKGAFKVLENAKNCADENPGYSVFDVNGANIYTPNTAAFSPYLVRVSITDLNIRKGPGTNYGKTGKYTGKPGRTYYPAIIDKETFDKAEEIRMKRAKALGRVWELEGKKDILFPTSFTIPAVKKISDDPFEQAAYAYSLIESEVDMGGTE